MTHPKGFTHILIVVFITVIAAGVVGAAWYYDQHKYDKGLTDSSIPCTDLTGLDACLARIDCTPDLKDEDNIGNEYAYKQQKCGKENWSFMLHIPEFKSCMTLSCEGVEDGPEMAMPGENTNTNTNTVVDETADWQTYTNEKYLYSVKYDDPYTIRDISTDEELVFDCGIETSCRDAVKILSFVSVEEWKNSIDPLIIISTEEIKIGGVIIALRINTSEFATSRVGVVKNGIFYEIYGDHFLDNGLLSTFEFIEVEVSASDQFQGAVSNGSFDGISSLLASDIQYTLMSSGCCAGYTVDEVITDLSMRVDGSSTYNFDQSQSLVDQIKASHSQYEGSLVGISDEDEVLIYKVAGSEITYIQYGATTKLYVGS